MPTRIAECLARLRESRRLAFMPFVSAGDPDLEMTQDLIRGLGAQGVDLIEVGFPYSDPIADGPVIQASYTRALQRGVHVAEIFEAIGSLDAEDLPPLVAMVSYAIIFRYGVERFVGDAQRAGFAGLIVPDLPGDEAGETFELVRAHELDLIQLIAPTTPRERVKCIVEHCCGFVYCVAVAGTTGARNEIASALLDQLRWLRNETDLPLCVGFGISRPEHLKPLRELADGVIVGSAIVKHLQTLADGSATRDETLRRITEFAAEMCRAAHGDNQPV